MSEAEEPTDIQPGQTPTPEVPAPRVRGRKRRAMGRWTRRFLKLLAVIIATTLITFFTVDLGKITIGGRSLRTLAQTFGSKFLERELTIGRLSAYIAPGKFRLDNVEIKGPFPGSRPFFKADRIDVDLKWIALFTKELYLEINLHGWQMVVEKWPDGKAHLPNLKSKNPSSNGKFPLKIRGLEVYGHDGGAFIYDDHLLPWQVTGPNLKFALVRANNLNTYVGSAEFSEGLVQIQKAEPMSADFKTRFRVDNGLVKLEHIDLLTDGAESHIAGYVNFGNWPEQEYDIQSDVDFNRMREIFWNKQTWRLSGFGHFNGIFKIARDNKFDLSGLFHSDEAGLGIGKTEWRFPGLSGALQWTPEKFAVSHATSEFLGGRMQLVYNLGPLGQPGGATGSLAAEYDNVDLFRFTRQFGWTALEPQGRMHGHISMGWHNGAFEETMQGFGASVIAPTGGAVASPVLPVSARLIPPEIPFQPFRPLGEFPLAGDVAYRFTASTLDFENSWAATPSTYIKFKGHARGGPVNVPFQVTSHDWQKSDRLFAAIMSNFAHPVGAIEVGGRGTFEGSLTKAFNAPRIEGHFVSDDMRAWGEVWGHATGDIAVENSYLTVTNGVVVHPTGGRILTDGQYSLGYRSDGGEEIHAHIRAEHMPLEPLKSAFTLKDWPLEGDLALADLDLAGQYEKPAGKGLMRIENATAWNEPIDLATADLVFDGDGSVRLNRVEITKGPGLVTGNAWLSWAGDQFLVNADSMHLPIDQLKSFRIEKAPLSGVLTDLNAHGSGTYDAPVWQIRASVPDLYIGDEGIGSARARLTIANSLLTIEEISAASVRLQASCRGTVAMTKDYGASVRCQYSNTSLDPYFKFLGQELPFTKAVATGTINLTGPLSEPAKLSVDARVDDTAITLFKYDLFNDGPLELVLRNNVFTLQRVRFKGDTTKGDKTAFELTGAIDLAARTSDVHARGQANLELLKVFYPDSLSVSTGDVDLKADLSGSFDNIQLTGTAQITNGRLRYRDAPGLGDINGPITIANGRISVEGLTAVVGEGPVEFHGSIGLNGYKPDEFDLHAFGQSLNLNIPDGLRSTVIASLDLTGPVTGARLSGTIEVLRASYAIQVDPQQGYIGLLRGAVATTPDAPVATELSSEPAFPVQLDIRVRAPIMPLVENKAANAEILGSADVYISGTIDHPIVTGRVDLDSGKWDFSGNHYRLLGGSIDFSNPMKFEPYFDLTAEASVRNPGQVYQVTVRITGTLDKLNPSLNSEPSLPEFQIISLLLGETPDTGRAELHALTDAKELQQQALYKASVAIMLSPVSGTLGSVIQRATTLNTQIVPLLYTNDANLQQLSPGLRLILGRKISERIYLTYSRTLSGTQNDVVLIEFNQNDQLSWVLSRNEDRSFALDFRLRYIFK